MKTLIVEDDFVSRLYLQEILKNYGPTHIAVNGNEAVEAVRISWDWDSEEPYNLICMDIMMPEMDGQETVRQIRAIEESKGIFSNNGAKIVMVTALGDLHNVFTAYKNLCDAYLTKPIKKSELLLELEKMELIK